MNIKRKQTLWNRTFSGLFLINFFSSMSQFMMNAVVPKYSSSLGAAAVMIGTIAGIQSIAAIAIKPIVGPCVNSVPKKILLVIVRAVSFIAAIGHGLSTTIGVLIIFRLLLGVSMGFSLALTMTMVSDSLPNEKMGSRLGIFSLGQALATAIGPYVGLEIINSIGYRNTFFFAAALNLISIVLIFVVKMDTNEKVKPFKINLNNMIAVECWKPAIILCLFSMSYSTFSSYLALYADGKSIQNIGLFFSTYAIMLLLSRPLSGKLTDKYGSLRVVIPCCFLFSIAFCFISFGNNIIMMLIAAIISAFAYGGVSPAMQAMCITLVSKEQRAAASSTSYLGMDIGHFIGPVLAGVIIDAVSGIRGYEVMFLACIFPIAIALAFAFSSLKSVNIKQSLVD